MTVGQCALAHAFEHANTDGEVAVAMKQLEMICAVVDATFFVDIRLIDAQRITAPAVEVIAAHGGDLERLQYVRLLCEARLMR